MIRPRRTLHGYDNADLPDAEELAQDQYEIDQERRAAALANFPQQRSEKDG
jgi:hypothetical protein